MRKYVIMLIVLLVCLLGVSMVSAQEGTEDSEEITFEMPIIENDVPYEGAFETSSMQLFPILGSEGDVVSITMTPGGDDSTTDPFVILLGPNGEVIAYNDDSTNSDLQFLSSEIVDAELPVDGIYFVVATTFTELRDQTVSEENPLDPAIEYVLTVSGFTPSEDVQTFNFTQFSPDDSGVTSVSGDLTLVIESPVFYVGFLAEEGQTISFSASEATDSATPLSDPLVYVFDSTGARIAGVDDTEGLYPSLEVEAPDTGQYLIFITSYFFWGAAEDPENYAGIGDFFAELNVE